MKYKPFTENEINFFLQTGLSIKELKNRQTGKSTGIALKTIGFALLYPNIEIPIRDHFPERTIENDSIHMSDKYLSKTIFDFIKMLNLKGFTINQSNLSLKYNLDLSDLE